MKVSPAPRKKRVSVCQLQPPPPPCPHPSPTPSLPPPLLALALAYRRHSHLWRGTGAAPNSGRSPPGRMAADNLFIQGRKMCLGGRRGGGRGAKPPSVTKTLEATSVFNRSPRASSRQPA